MEHNGRNTQLCRGVISTINPRYTAYTIRSFVHITLKNVSSSIQRIISTHFLGIVVVVLLNVLANDFSETDSEHCYL